MILVVDDEMGNLQEANVAKMRRMSRESLQAWATARADKASEIIQSNPLTD